MNKVVCPLYSSVAAPVHRFVGKFIFLVALYFFVNFNRDNINHVNYLQS